MIFKKKFRIFFKETLKNGLHTLLQNPHFVTSTYNFSKISSIVCSAGYIINNNNLLPYKILFLFFGIIALVKIV